MYIVASDGVETQARKLKSTVSLPKAKMLVESRFEILAGR